MKEYRGAAPRCLFLLYGGFPRIIGTFLGAPIIRTIVFWGLYWGPLILGNYHITIITIVTIITITVIKP